MKNYGWSIYFGKWYFGFVINGFICNLQLNNWKPKAFLYRNIWRKTNTSIHK